MIGETDNTEVAQVFIDKAHSVKAPIVFSELYMNDFEAEKKDYGWLFQSGKYPNLKGELKGMAQDKNARTVLTTVEALLETGYNIPAEAVYKGFANVTAITGLMGRWQQLRTSPEIICDIAHNAHGLKYVAEQLLLEDYNRLHIVFGMANDKDVDSVLTLMPQNAVYYFTRASVERALNEKTLAGYAAAHGLAGYIFPSVSHAVEAALKTPVKMTSFHRRQFLYRGRCVAVVYMITILIQSENY